MCPRQWSNTSSVNKGYSIASDHRESLSPFCASAGCPSQVQISIFLNMVTPLARAKYPFLQPTFPFFCSQLFHVEFGSSHANILTCLSQCSVQLNFWKILCICIDNEPIMEQFEKKKTCKKKLKDFMYFHVFFFFFFQYMKFPLYYILYNSSFIMTILKKKKKKGL